MAYIGKVKISPSASEAVPIASTLYGVCNTAANGLNKVVTCNDFEGTYIKGMTIHVQLTNGNTATGGGNLTLKSGNATYQKDLLGYWPRIQPNGIVSLTYDGNRWYFSNTQYKLGTGLTYNASDITTIDHSNSITARDSAPTWSSSGSVIPLPFEKYDAQGHIVTGMSSVNFTISGIDVAHGGTGVTTFSSGEALIGAGTNAITTKVISTSASASTSSNLITEGAVVNGLNTKVNNNLIGASNGIATLDANGMIPSAQLPSIAMNHINDPNKISASASLGLYKMAMTAEGHIADYEAYSPDEETIMLKDGKIGTIEKRFKAEYIPIVIGPSASRVTVSVPGITYDTDMIVSPHPATLSDYVSLGVYCLAQGNGTLTFAIGEPPSTSTTVYANVMGWNINPNFVTVVV